jgi:hypothetical protein
MLRCTRYTRGAVEVTLQQDAIPMTHSRSALKFLAFSAEPLASAPNLRLIIVRLAIFRATHEGSKSYRSKYIELIRMPVHFWVLNCHIRSRSAGRNESQALSFALRTSVVSSEQLGAVVLKITITDSSDEERWSLQGLLIGQWAAELKSTWKERRHAGNTRRCIVELIEVTAIDHNGEAVLAEIMSQGAEFIAGDVYAKHLLRKMRSELRRNRQKGKEDLGGNH